MPGQAESWVSGLGGELIWEVQEGERKEVEEEWTRVVYVCLGRIFFLYLGM